MRFDDATMAIAVPRTALMLLSPALIPQHFLCRVERTSAIWHRWAKPIHTGSAGCAVSIQFGNLDVLDLMAHPQRGVVRGWPGRAQTFGR